MTFGSGEHRITKFEYERAETMTKTPTENLSFRDHLALRYGPEEAARMMAGDDLREDWPVAPRSGPPDGVGAVSAGDVYPVAGKASGGPEIRIQWPREFDGGEKRAGVAEDGRRAGNGSSEGFSGEVR